MKIITLILAAAAAVWAQPAQVISGDIVFSGGTVDMTASRYVKPFRIVAASPSGACALAWDTVYSSEDSKIYTCQSGSWVVIAADGTTVGVGTSPPGTCSVGQLFFDSNATAGENLYGCTATNTWTQLGGSGTYTAGTGLSLVNGEFAVDTDEIESRANAQAGATRYCSSATGNDTYTCTMTPTLTAYTTGMVITLNAGTANTGAATLNIDSLGAKSILKRDGSALVDSDIPANKPILIAYDGTQFVLVGAAASGDYSAGTGLSLVGSEFSANTAVLETRANAQAGASTYCASATGNDTYTCTMTPTLTAYTAGSIITLNADTANTGAATLNIDTLGAKSILKRNGDALADSDIPANKPVLIAYDGTQFVLVGDGGGGTADPNTVTASGTLT